jgi:hypothetical protein
MHRDSSDPSTLRFVDPDVPSMPRALEMGEDELLFKYTKSSGYPIWGERGEEVEQSDKPIVFSRLDHMPVDQPVALLGVSKSAFLQAQHSTQVVAATCKGSKTIRNTCHDDIAHGDKIAVDMSVRRPEDIPEAIDGHIYPKMYIVKGMEHGGKQLVDKNWKLCVQEAQGKTFTDTKNLARFWSSKMGSADFPLSAGGQAFKKQLLNSYSKINVKTPLLMTTESVKAQCAALVKIYVTVRKEIIDHFVNYAVAHAGGDGGEKAKSGLMRWLDMVNVEVMSLLLRIAAKMDSDMKNLFVGTALGNSSYGQWVHVYIGHL